MSLCTHLDHDMLALVSVRRHAFKSREKLGNVGQQKFNECTSIAEHTK